MSGSLGHVMKGWFLSKADVTLMFFHLIFLYDDNTIAHNTLKTLFNIVEAQLKKKLNSDVCVA